MATIMIGSARHDERGKLVGGKAGDQLQKSGTNDTTGEVSMQAFYVHKLGWMVSRPKTAILAAKVVERTVAACNNPNIGYDQNQKTGLIKNGIDSKVPTETDCSTLERAVVKEASGIDPGKNTNMTTKNEVELLEATGLFEKAFKYKNQKETPIYDGDILTTCTKGHTVTVVSGSPRPDSVVTKPTTDGEEVYNMPTITKGSKGKAVKIWQIIIGVDADGSFGPATLTATKAYQTKHGLTVDGKVGPATWKYALNHIS